MMSSSCRLCGYLMGNPVHHGKLIGNNVKYYECRNCYYVQTEEPFWLKKAYESTITASDTGIMIRNIINRNLTLATLAVLGERRGMVVDYAGGFGLLVRTLRDLGINAYWHDCYSRNLVAQGFKYLDGKAALVTAFEAFEHFVKPDLEMEKLLEISANVLITTTLIPAPTPRPCEWDYYGVEHGQHIGFFRKRSLEYIAQKHELHLLTDGQCVHLFSKKPHSRRAWKLFLKLSKINIRAVTLGLQPLTWIDHQSIKSSSFQ